MCADPLQRIPYHSAPVMDFQKGSVTHNDNSGKDTLRTEDQELDISSICPSDGSTTYPVQGRRDAGANSQLSLDKTFHQYRKLITPGCAMHVMMPSILI